MSLHRRELLLSSAATGLAALLPAAGRTQEAVTKPAWHKSLIAYLETLAREDGGYGWDGQERSHLTPTFAIVGCYKLLGIEPPRKAALAQFIRTHHPRELKGKLEQEHREFEWQQIQSLVWLGEDAASFHNIVQGWKAPFAYPKQYEQHGYPVFQPEVSAILSRKLLGLPMSELPAAYISYLDSRRRANGSFNNTPASDGSDGHVLNTWWGLQALDALGRTAELKEETITWLQKCWSLDTAFTHQPNPEIGGFLGVDYSWAAIRSLALLGAKPTNHRNCVAYLHSLRHDDGGFGDHSAWPSNPLATYSALDALAALGVLDSIDNSPPKSRSSTPIVIQNPHPDSGLKVFSIQLEAHGQGSPAEAVELADALRIHLWGAKNAKPEWLARGKAIAAERNVDVKFFVSNEEYGTWIDVPGMGTYSHMSDIAGPIGVNLGSALTGNNASSWSDFRRLRLGDTSTTLRATVRPGRGFSDKPPEIRPLRMPARDGGFFTRNGGRLIWQFGENEPLVRLLLDDSLLYRNSGFAAISTYHFGNPDFTNTEPFLMRYRGVIPFVALQDAHGAEPWWFADMTEGFRTLFLATSPTWEGWVQALRNNWVVAARHDPVSGGKTWMHGTHEIVEFVKERWRDWQWWDNPAIQRPFVSVVVLTPQDQFEIARPEKGIAIRVRCAHENTTQGLPKKALAEFIALTLAGQPVAAEHVIRRRANRAIEDDYHLYLWPDAPPGKHTATATVRNLATGAELKQSIVFTV
jgi:hypothetical protein